MHETYCVLIDFFIASRQNFLESPIIIAKWGGKKKQDFKKLSLVEHGRKKKSFKCNCGFLLKNMLPISFSQSLNCDPKNKIVEVTICVHTKHNGHKLEFKNDKYFLPMQPLVIVVF